MIAVARIAFFNIGGRRVYSRWAAEQYRDETGALRNQSGRLRHKPVFGLDPRYRPTPSPPERVLPLIQSRRSAVWFRRERYERPSFFQHLADLKSAFPFRIF